MAVRMRNWSRALEFVNPTFTDIGDQEYEDIRKSLETTGGIVRKIVKEVLSALQRIKKFREFPLHVQQDIVSYGHFIALEHKRVVYRQGHLPIYWYFVVRGQGLARQTMAPTNEKRTVEVFSQGVSFGEADIENDCRRKYTVVSRRSLEVIAISKNRYKQIFAAKLSSVYPEHVQFLREMSFMKDWPIDRLLKHPTQCFFLYYRKNELIDADSKQSKYIYVIQSGCCVLYMRMERMQASWRDLQLHLIHPMIHIAGWPEAKVDSGPHWRPGADAYVLYNRFSSTSNEVTDLAAMPKLDIPVRAPPVKFKLDSASCSDQDLQEEPLDLLPASDDGQDTAASNKPRVKGLKKSQCGSDKSKQESKGKAKQEKAQEKEKGEKKKQKKKKAKECGEQVQDKEKTAKKERFAKEEEEKDERKRKREVKNAKWAKPLEEARPSKKSRDMKSCRYQSLATAPREPHKDPYSVYKDPVYVLIDTLTAGDVFGLEDLKLPDLQKDSHIGTLRMVSLGAEVIGLSKNFYACNCTLRCQQEVYHQQCVYPSTQAVRFRYRKQLAWSLYTQKVSNELLADAGDKDYPL